MTRAAAITQGVATWFSTRARDLPWRTSPRDPWRSLVSEFMLQQTQVDRVCEKYEPFLARFPTPRDLAAAPMDDVLAAWAGLGYYRRARNLHAAACAIVEYFDGAVPADVNDLLTLPGIGRYTAGAIASMVHGRREPIVDGNVRRVLLRLEGQDLPEGSPADRFAWEQAAALVACADDPAAFNEGLMELGAMVCTPRSPRCPECPVARVCRAHERGLQEDIPRPRRRPQRSALYCATVVRRDARGRIALRRRPDTGLWAGMWEAPTLERGEAPWRGDEIAAWWGGPVEALDVRLTHQTTHRIVHFEAWETHEGLGDGVEWRAASEVAEMGISNAQRRLLGMAGVLEPL